MPSPAIVRFLTALALLALGLAALPARAQTEPATYYVPKQVLVAGLEGAVNAATSPNTGVQLEELAKIDLSYTVGLPAIPGFPFSGRKGLVIKLFTITNGDSVATAIAKVTRNARAQNPKTEVRAEPNYVVGRDPAMVQGNPWSVGGSPWSVGGSGGGDGAAAAAGFLDQWAFGPRGVSLFAGSGEQRQRRVAATGAGVHVAIFDTSPFSLPQGVTSGSALVDWITPTLKLDLLQPTLQSLPQPQSPLEVGDHGLFVAGIIHAIAPDSQIQLVRVLDKYGQGDLFSLCAALHGFIAQRFAAGESGVINLSLGVFPSQNPADAGLPSELSALQTAVLAADGAGLAVVAAAGNQAAAAQQLPAGYATVLGVTGSTAGRGLSCFANRPGDIGAPGGDGSAPGCTPKIDSCVGPCAVAIVSLNSSGGYSYWLGTSFAAPFASGAAALLIGQSGGALAPADLRARLLDGAGPTSLPAGDTSLGAGILSLPRALYPYPSYLPLLVR